jgi:hypothetical protein
MRAAPCPPLLESGLRLSMDGCPVVTKWNNAKLRDNKSQHIFHGNPRGGEMGLSEIVMQRASPCIEMQMGICDITMSGRVPMIAQDFLARLGYQQRVMIGDGRYLPGSTLTLSLYNAVLLRKIYGKLFVATEYSRAIIERQHIGVFGMFDRRSMTPTAIRQDAIGYTRERPLEGTKKVLDGFCCSVSSHRRNVYCTNGSNIAIYITAG